MKCFHHKTPIKSEDQPYKNIPLNYVARQQYMEPEDEAPNLNEYKKRLYKKWQENTYIMQEWWIS